MLLDASVLQCCNFTFNFYRMASENGLNISLFERYAEKYRKAREGTQEAPGQKHLFIQLEEQYRMVNSLYKYRVYFVVLAA